jgi:LacI family transcriptional regulator
MVTSHQVAKHAGVSQSSVSRVLNGNPKVDERIRKKVLQALEELNYVPNASAKSMRTARSGTIGIVAAEILNPYFPILLDAFTRAARDRGLGVLLWNEDDPDAPTALRSVAARAVDGVVFTAARSNLHALQTLSAQGVPVILANRAPEHISADQVGSDHERTGYEAASYLLERGRTDIAAIFGPRDTFASPARERGFTARLVEADMRVPDERWLIGETSYDHGRASTKKVLSTGQLPSALYCSADIIAFGAMSALREAGVRIPEDIWVMGNDDLPMAAWSMFDLTTFRQPVDEIAAAGLDLLVARIGGATDAPQRMAIPTELVVRGSTAHS